MSEHTDSKRRKKKEREIALLSKLACCLLQLKVGTCRLPFGPVLCCADTIKSGRRRSCRQTAVGRRRVVRGVCRVVYVDVFTTLLSCEVQPGER